MVAGVSILAGLAFRLVERGPRLGPGSSPDLAGGGYVRWDTRTPPAMSFVGAAYSMAPPVLARVVPQGERAAAFDAGALAYAGPAVVVNLDGLMNHDVVASYASCPGRVRACLLEYLRARRITVLAGGSAFGWTRILPDWSSWERLYESPALRDGDRLVVVRVPAF